MPSTYSFVCHKIFKNLLKLIENLICYYGSFCSRLCRYKSCMFNTLNLPYISVITALNAMILFLCLSFVYSSTTDVHKIPARVQCTVQVFELACRTCTPHHTVAGRSSVSLTQSPFAFLSNCRCGPPLTSYMPGRAVPSRARVHTQQHTSSHTVRCARLLHLCSTTYFGLTRLSSDICTLN
jgi:hypothetical protein